jgi:hypothetical protein
MAGRSTLINANISTQGGDLALLGNTDLEGDSTDTVRNNNRDAGAAVIVMAEGTAINAGKVDINLYGGEEKTHRSSGNITLRAITANKISVNNFGPTDGSGIVLASGTLTASNNATAIELTGQTFTNNAGASALSAPNGRWLVWSEDPASDNRGGLAYNFKQYKATYGSSPAAQSTGNGFLYSISPSITPILAGTVAKTYDRSTIADLTGLSISAINGAVDGDQVLVSLSAASGTYDTKNAGTGKAITLSGLSSASSNGAATVYGYQLNTPALTGTISPKAVTARGISVRDKVYDGLRTTGALEGEAGLVGVINGDLVNLVPTQTPIGLFDDKTVGENKDITVSGYSLSGQDQSNYSLNPVRLQGKITARPLTATGITANNKIYDGTVLASLDLSRALLNDVVGNDRVNLSSDSATAEFATKSVGVGKAVRVTGLSLSGADAGNYRIIASTFSTTADISAKVLTATGIVAKNKIFDGNSTASLIFSGARLNGVDVGDAATLNTTSVSATFADKAVGVDKVVTISGLGLSGADAGNYTIEDATTTADITADGTAILSTVLNAEPIDTSNYIRQGSNPSSDLPFGEIPVAPASSFPIAYTSDGSVLLTVKDAVEGDDEKTLRKKAVSGADSLTSQTQSNGE